MTYARMLEVAGFGEVATIDVSPEWRRTSDASLDGTIRYEAELRVAYGEAEYERLLRDRGADGLLVRALFVAAK